MSSTTSKAPKRRKKLAQGKEHSDAALGLQSHQIPSPEGAAETPEDWRWTTLGEIADVKGGITLNKSRKIENPIEVSYLRVANVQRGHLNLQEIKTVQIPSSRLADYLLQPGDILFNEGGDRDKLGRGWVWNGEIPDCCHQNHVFRARPNSDLVDSKFVSYWGNEFGREYFEREGKQTTNLASINRAKLRALPVPLPPLWLSSPIFMRWLEPKQKGTTHKFVPLGLLRSRATPLPPLVEQHQIVAQAEARTTVIDHLEAELDRQITRSNRLRQSTLAAAFSGSL